MFRKPNLKLAVDRTDLKSLRDISLSGLVRKNDLKCNLKCKQGLFIWEFNLSKYKDINNDFLKIHEMKIEL